jgi:hypothetical protein
LAQARNLSGKDLIVTVVVSDRAHKTAALRKIERGIWPPISEKATTKLGREIRSVGRASAVATDEQLSTGAEAFHHRVHRAAHWLGQLVQRFKGAASGADRFV